MKTVSVKHYFIAIFFSFQLSEIMSRCCQFMTSLFQINNFSHYIDLANEIDLLWLLFLEWNFVQLTEDEKFGTLASPPLYRPVSCQGLWVGRVETFYQAVMKWYSVHPTER